MPEGRLQRTRPTLPVGYQFGDARVFGALLHRRGPGNVMLTSDGLNELIRKCFPSEWRRHTGAYADAIRGINAVNSERADSWRAPHENAAEQLKRQATCICAPFLSGESVPSVGEIVTCPKHPERAIYRGPSADC